MSCIQDHTRRSYVQAASVLLSSVLYSVDQPRLIHIDWSDLPARSLVAIVYLDLLMSYSTDTSTRNSKTLFQTRSINTQRSGPSTSRMTSWNPSHFSLSSGESHRQAVQSLPSSNQPGSAPEADEWAVADRDKRQPFPGLSKSMLRERPGRGGGGGGRGRERPQRVSPVIPDLR